MAHKNNSIAAIVLAGGQGSRMGFKDKGLLPFLGRPLILHVTSRINPQVAELVISCNRNIDQYKKLGFPIVQDERSGFAGPLAGILSAQNKITSSFCLIVPCDMPYIPLNIVNRLKSAMGNHEAVTAVVDDMLEPLVSVVETRCIRSIEDYLVSGRHSVRGWLETLNGTVAAFEKHPDAFRNINTPEELF